MEGRSMENCWRKLKKEGTLILHYHMKFDMTMPNELEEWKLWEASTVEAHCE